MGLYQRLKEAVIGSNKQAVKPFAVSRGTQASYDTKSYMMRVLQTYELPENDLELYKVMGENVPILAGAINAYVRMINSDFDILAKNQAILTKAKDICEALDLEGVINKIIRQFETFGFCACEIVLSDDWSEIIRLKVIDSRTLRVQKDPYGNIIAYKQIIGVASGTTSTMAGVVTLNPNLVMYFQRNPEGDSAYGSSLFRSVPKITSTMLTIEEAIGTIYKRYGSPKFHVSYNPVNQIPDEMMTDRMDTIKTAFGNLGADTDFFSNGEIEVNVLTPGSGAISFTEELRHVVEQLLSGIGLPAAVLGYNYGSTETHIKEQDMILVSNLKNTQQVIRRTLTNSLLTLMAQVYGFSEVPTLEWHEIQIRDEFQDAQADKLKIENAIIKRDNGITDQQTCAVELGYRFACDPNYKADMKLGRYTSDKSLSAQGVSADDVNNEAEGSNDPNTV